jgi:ABC-type bacteriocin/lantibiotic exporter with double-glycine peptidase domain
MHSKPPFVAQERSDSCALACLRMLLAYQGTHVSEADLFQEIAPLRGGLPLEELAQLARRLGFHAGIRQLGVSQLAELIDRGTFPIVYLDRSSLDGEFAVHAVIPVRVTQQFVTFLDPLRGERRVSKRKFESAWRRLDHVCVICEIGGETHKGPG